MQHGNDEEKILEFYNFHANEWANKFYACMYMYVLHFVKEKFKQDPDWEGKKRFVVLSTNLFLFVCLF
jgi:hypothetical protein